MKNFSKIILGCVLMSGLTISSTAAPAGEPETGRRAAQKFELKAAVWGPTKAETEAAKRRVEKSPALKKALSGSNYRFISLAAIERTAADKTSLEPTHFRAFYYDYDTGKTFVAESDFAGTEPVAVRPSKIGYDVSVNYDEVRDGYEVVKQDPRLGPLYKAGKLELSPPMPPIRFYKGERLVNIRIKHMDTGIDEIVGVSFKHKQVVFYTDDPLPASSSGGSCGIPNSTQGSTGPGVPGQLTLTVNSSGGDVLWEMLIIRPSSSSGAPWEQSGIEVRDVKYRGKSVLKRGHAPILNVKYHPGGCGPSFRDWQYAEDFFDAPEAGAQNPTDGFRILAAGQVATTSVESGNDTGNFQGVAIYQQDVGFGNEVVLVSEMNAGWYRYIMEWRFAEDGTIRPRYGFGSVQNNCVCAARNHHVYWRFDFDIVSPANDIYRVERGRRFLTPIITETKMFRSYQTNRSILIQNSNGDEAYQLTPNFTDEEAYNYEDGALQTFGAGDFWIMNFKGQTGAPEELDDPNPTHAAALDPWINGEPLGNTDAVVWYGAHQFRNDATSLTNFDRSGLVLEGVHVVGPDLRPVRW